MNFAFVINDAYVDKMLVTAISICINNPGKHTFYVFTTGLTDENTALLHRVLSYYNSIAVLINIDDRCLNGVPILRKDFNKTPYYKLLIPVNLPDAIDKILYMDADMIVKGDLTELYNSDLGGTYFAAVPDSIRNEKDKPYLEKLGINYAEGERYFNSGFILFNVSEFKKIYSLDHALEYIKKNGSTFKYHDQEVLNGLYHKNYTQLNNAYNYFTGFHSIKEMILYWIGLENTQIKNAKVLHYANLKPWNNNYVGKCENYYWEYAVKCEEIYIRLMHGQINSFLLQYKTVFERVQKKITSKIRKKIL